MDRLTLRRIFLILKESEVSYLTIGGIAAGALGEPRYTADIDVLLYLAEDELDRFLRTVRERKVKIDIGRQKALAHRFGGMRFKIGKVPIDCLLAGTLFEFEALKRRQWISWAGTRIAVPSPEDLILMKLAVGRERDLLDARNVAARNQDQLDRKYLKQWAQWLGKGRRGVRVTKRLNAVLRSLN